MMALAVFEDGPCGTEPEHVAKRYVDGPASVDDDTLPWPDTCIGCGRPFTAAAERGVDARPVR